MKPDILIHLNVTVTGNQDASETIVFAHGFGTDQTAWKDVVPAFFDDYRIILYDNPGAGSASPEAFSPIKYNSLNAYADDLISICHELGIQQAILVVHSVSGMISVLASIKDPSLFRKMVLVGASPRYLNDEGYAGGFEKADLEGLFQAMDSNYFAWVSGFSAVAMGNPDRPSLAESFANTLLEIRPDIAKSVSRVIFQSDHRDDLPLIHGKDILIVQSNDDIAVPMSVAEYLHDHLENSKLEVVNASGHFPHISAPEEIIKAVKNFI